MRRPLALAAALCLGVVTPAIADAATRFVAKGGSDIANNCTNSGAPCATIAQAVVQAGEGDTIQIGAGTYTERVETAKALTFIGAGAGTVDGIPALTVVRGPAGSGGDGSPALVLQNGGNVNALRAEGGKGDNETLTIGDGGGDGIVYESAAPGQSALHLDHVVAVGGNGGTGQNPADPFEVGTAGRGVEVRGGPGEVAISATSSGFASGTGAGGGGAMRVFGPGAVADLTDSKLTAAGPIAGGAITGFSGARLTLDSVVIESENGGATIFEGSMTIRRSSLQGAFPLEVSASGGDTATAQLVDSLVVSAEGDAAFIESEEAGSTATLNVVGSTIVGLISGAAVDAIRDEGAGPATVTLRNSIARHQELPPPFPAIDLLADGGTIDADFSSFTTRVEENGGTASAPGSAGNVAGSPHFIDESTGNFALQGTSPLIDRGSTALVAADELDLAGSPRSVDGNRDCLPAPDIGAFEVTGQSATCPDPIPVISKFGMTNRTFAPKGGKKPHRRGARTSAKAKHVKRGTKFTYTLSEPAGVKIAIERKKAGKGKKPKFAKVTTLSQQKKSGKQSTKFSGQVKGKPLKPGKYRATITASDSAGQKSQPRQITFKIVSG
jgi:hypothetical protein